MSLNEAKEFTTKLFKNSNSLQVCSIYHVRFHWIWETSEIHFLQRSTKSCRRHFRKNKSVWSSIYYYYLHLNIIVDGYCPIRRGGGFSPTYQWQQIVIVYSRRQATQAILLKNGPFQASFFFIFVFSTQLTVNKCSINFDDGLIRTADLWYWKQLLYQLSHNHCKNLVKYSSIFKALLDAFRYLMLSLKNTSSKVAYSS